MKLKEIYISVDVEATGPIPGDYSLSALGAFIAGGRTEEGDFVRFSHDEQANLFYAELKPISENFVPQAILVGLLELFENEDLTPLERHQRMKEFGREPAEVMAEFASWVNSEAKRYSARPLFVAYPASFDWMFVYWYMTHFNVESPFGFSGVRDLKEMYATKAGVPFNRSSKRYMPRHLLKSNVKHTHHALDDARGQGDLCMNLLEWQR